MSNATTRGIIGRIPFSDYNAKYPAASTAQIFYPNILVGILTAGSSAGYLDVLDDTAARKFIGVTAEVQTQVLSGGNNGDTLVDVNQPRGIKVAANWTPAITDVGKRVYAIDNQTVALTGTTYGNYVGKIVEIGSTWSTGGFAIQTTNPYVIVECDYAIRNYSPFGVTTLTGTADAIDPHEAATYVVTGTSAIDAMTLAAPTAAVDDGTVITFTSNSAYAHTLTATGLFQTGSTTVNLATFAAHPGASLTIVAVNGKWNVLSTNAVTMS